MLFIWVSIIRSIFVFPIKNSVVDRSLIHIYRSFAIVSSRYSVIRISKIRALEFDFFNAIPEGNSLRTFTLRVHERRTLLSWSGHGNTNGELFAHLGSGTHRTRHFPKKNVENSPFPTMPACCQHFYRATTSNIFYTVCYRSTGPPRHIDTTGRCRNYPTCCPLYCSAQEKSSAMRTS